MRATMRLLTAGVATLVVLLLVLAGCELPSGVPFSSVERPDYNNPVDPASRVLIADILPLIPDLQFRQAVADAAAQRGAVYNTDIRDLYISTLMYGLSSVEGIQYLPALDSLRMEGNGGPTPGTLAPLSGHARLRRLEIDGLDTLIVSGIPAIAPLESLSLTNLTGANTWTPNDLPVLNLREFNASGTTMLVGLSGIERLGPLEVVRVSGTGVTILHLTNDLPAVSSTLRDLDITDPGTYTFLGLLPNLGGLGVVIDTLDVPFVQGLATYGNINRFRFSGVTGENFDPLSLFELPLATLKELAVQISSTPTVAVTLDFATFAGSPLEHFSFSYAPADSQISFINLGALPQTLIRLELRLFSLTDSQLYNVAFGNLRFLDISNSGLFSLAGLAANAGMLSNLEEIQARDSISPTGFSPDPLINGIPELYLLPKLRYLNAQELALSFSSGPEQLINNSLGRVRVDW